MFKKLLSNLSFTPSLIEEVNTYLISLSKELKARLIGTYLLITALAIHVVAITYPQDKLAVTACEDSNERIKCSLPQSSLERAGNLPEFAMGAALAVVISLIFLSAYLAMRSWLLARELKIIKKQEATGRTH